MANVLDLLARVLDNGTYRSWDTAPAGPRPGPAYAADLDRARAATGLDESVVTGEGLLRGHRVAVAAGEFGFLGGSIGVTAGERITQAAERALASSLPFIVLPASGGTRMQEGTVAFVQMVKITAAVTALKQAGLPYLVYLRHPTTGGVFASWASLGHVTAAEPGALIGFLGPRVYEALEGRPFPPGVQTAENLAAHGLIDAVVRPDDLAEYLGEVLEALSPGSSPAPAGDDPGTADAPVSAWDSVLRTRKPGRPRVAGLLRAAAETSAIVRHSGGLMLSIARIGGRPCVVAGQDGGAVSAGALRQARRGMRLAGELRVPFVSVIDTSGAELSAAAEENGIAGEIAQCIAAMIGLRVPTVSVLLGQGTGGGALALLPADRVLAAGHGWLAPLAPEGASAIVYKDTEHAPELAERQRIGAPDLAAAGIADRVIGETPGLAADLAAALRSELDVLSGAGEDARLAARLRRYRHLGHRLLP